ncbi:acyl-CoA synthetase (NDP forming) [Polaromonas sp. CF318]|uniref:bifunctional acetate--CoA ligase family protein/GNAT family N-acetyltransferase n=1 Tax=Polaromonas sp. CF318 TaxID=1144318 RepID=UPI00027100D5|nr:acetate--CoA ligase family protein [Polaromonas sp. CF318]EJL88490.1 acyl-CoA synthetase (NDP forming) [Polaromonas sp. CF318]
MSVRNLEALLQPRSVALIGASDRANSVGAVVLRNLKAGGFKGPIWPVNHKHTRISGEQAWPDAASLPGTPDLAVICTPAASVPAIVAELGRRGTRAAIVMSAGLRQARKEGGTWESAMLDAARPHLLRVVGPNCLGILVPGIGLNASFAPGNALPGNIAFVTQSGALATAMLDWANGRGIGFSHFISLGDVADVDFGDVLDYLGSDPGTRAILMYMESVTSARKFMSAARAAARNKPVIVVKGGRAPDGARAAASHTGALAGSDLVFDAAVRRAGMLRVDTLEDLFGAAETLAHRQAWAGHRLAVLTNGGGAGVLAADALALGGGRLAELSPQTLAALDACLPPAWSHGNPVDIVGDAPVSRYQDALRILLAAPEVDGVLFMHAPTAIVPANDIAAACLPLVAQRAKTVLACWLGAPSVASARASFSGAGVPCFDTPERAVTAWLHLAAYARNQAALRELPGLGEQAGPPDTERIGKILQEAAACGQRWLDAVQVHQVLQACGIAALSMGRARDANEAAALARRIGFPVALKVMSPDVVHKSDVGGVEIGLTSADEVLAAALRMDESLARLAPHAALQGFVVQAMADRPGALELIAGMARDPVFGPVILFGEGGTAVELHARHAVALAPVNDALAKDLVSRAGMDVLLGGYRGSRPADTAAVRDVLQKISRLACEQALLAELDINPLLVDEHGVLAVDARMGLHAPGAAPLPPAISPYPANLEAEVQLNGISLSLRPIRPEDGRRLATFYARATPADMRLRFFMARREVPHSELARYSQIDYDREMTFIALAPRAGDSPEMVGEVRAVCDPDNERAEFAIQVAAPWQGKGLGRLLLDRLLDYLRARGTAEVSGQCLRENTAMAGLARSAGFTVADAGDSDTFSMRLALNPSPHRAVGYKIDRSDRS